MSAEDKKLNSDIRFNNQAYMNSYIDEIIDSGVLKSKFSHVSRLITSQKSFAECIALLTGKAERNILTKLKTHQYNALLPKVTLYRVDQDGTELEFLFDKNSRFNYINVLGDNFITGNNCGIKSFDWVLAGSNPVSAQKNIEVKIEFYFDSINSFSGGSYDEMLKFWNKAQPDFKQSIFDYLNANLNKATQPPYYTVNYWSLIYHPSTVKTGLNTYLSSLFRIKAVVGWEELHPNLIKEIFNNDSSINEYITNSNLVMYLNLVAHNFQFNEDGSIKLTANYIGTFENATSNTNFDLFKGLKEQLEKLADENLFALTDRLPGRDNGEDLSVFGDDSQYESTTTNSRRLKFISYLRDNKGNIDDLSAAVTKCQVPFNVEKFKALNLTDEDYTSIITKYNNTLDLLEAKRNEVAVQIKNEFYSSLINELLLTDDNGGYLMYKLQLKTDKVKEWIRWKNGNPDAAKPTFLSDVLPNLDLNDNSSIKDRSNDLSETRVGKTLDEGNTAFEENETKIREQEEKIEDKSIYFTTVGIIVDCALKVVKKRSGASNQDFEKVKIIFANFAKDKCISDIPIDLNYYIKFLNDNVYQLQKEEYSFFQFLRDVISKLAETCLESRETLNKEVNKYSGTSLATTELALGNDSKDIHPLSNFYENNTRNINLNSTNISDLKKYFINKTNVGLYPYIYHVIYDKYQKDFFGTGNVKVDEQKGVYHYTIAQDFGLVKSINFKRIDQPYLKEAKSVGRKTVYLGQFRDLYNADMKLVGNNIYIPGMILLLKPSIEFGNPIGSVAAPSFSQITGVGGYYSVIKVSNQITQDSYTTSLDCVFQSNESQKLSNDEEGCNIEELKKAGIYDDDGLPILEEIDTANILGRLEPISEERNKQARQQEQQGQQDFSNFVI